MTIITIGTPAHYALAGPRAAVVRKAREMADQIGTVIGPDSPGVKLKRVERDSMTLGPLVVYVIVDGDSKARASRIVGRDVFLAFVGPVVVGEA